MEEVLRYQDVMSLVVGMKAAHHRVEPDAAQSGGEQQDRRQSGAPPERPETRRIVRRGSRLWDGRCDFRLRRSLCDRQPRDFKGPRSECLRPKVRHDTCVHFSARC